MSKTYAGSSSAGKTTSAAAAAAAAAKNQGLSRSARAGLQVISHFETFEIRS
jgi:hypothetical protein